MQPLVPMSDANWGPQDASNTNKVLELPLFASRSMSAFYVDLLRPLHWLSKRQQVLPVVQLKLKFMQQMNV